MGPKNIKSHSVPQLRRGTEQKSSDPYLSKRGLKEHTLCTMCQSIYHHKRWYPKEDPVARKLKNEPGKLTVCPACRKTREHYAEGVITLRGEFLSAHKDQILGLIHNEEARAKKGNPLDGIIAIQEMENATQIQTTSERFAERMGKEIKRAFKGKISYHWTHGDKFVRVEWHREGEKGKK